MERLPCHMWKTNIWLSKKWTFSWKDSYTWRKNFTILISWSSIYKCNVFWKQCTKEKARHLDPLSVSLIHASIPTHLKPNCLKQDQAFYLSQSISLKYRILLKFFLIGIHPLKITWKIAFSKSRSKVCKLVYRNLSSHPY